MAFETIVKPEDVRASAALSEESRARFSREDARAMLAGLPGGRLDIAHQALDAHVTAGRAGDPVETWPGKDGARRAVTCADLAGRTARFDDAVRAHELGPGDRLFGLMGREVELYVAALGTLKAGLVFSPLFSAFGPEPIRTRMEIGAANALVTTEALYRRKIAEWWRELPPLRLILIVGDDAPEGCVALGPAMAAASDAFAPRAAGPRRYRADPFHLGHDRAAQGGRPCPRRGRLARDDGEIALETRPGTRYWCTADPGWVTGTSYGIIAPVVNRVHMLVDEGEFDLDRWYSTLRDERIELWYTASTAIRMMMRAGDAAAKPCDFSALRFLASVGEPLNPEAVVWGNRVFGRPFHDTWWQTETGGIVIANTQAMDIKPGSMGKPLPGQVAAIVERDGEGVRELGEGEIGELALRPGWPAMMRAYLHEEARYAECFVGGWYLTGDLAMKDADDDFWFVGRADDLIKTSGHLIGPFAVESAPIEHEAVAEAAVIGLPDETAGEVVRAYVCLNPGFEASEEMEKSIRGHARRRLGPAVAPREVVFRKTLPKTRSGKIMRRLLKARELGLPEGDISTLESDET